MPPTCTMRKSVMMSLSFPTMKPRLSTNVERNKKDREGAVIGKSGVTEEVEAVEQIAELETTVVVEEMEVMVTRKDLGAATCEAE